MILKNVPSGVIRVEQGADGVYLLFDCDCKDALPYCHAACCCLPGIRVKDDEAKRFKDSGPKAEIVWNEDEREWQMVREPSGWCCLNHPTTHRCTRYEDRPDTCREFHCTRGAGMRGWRLELNRLDG